MVSRGRSGRTSSRTPTCSRRSSARRRSGRDDVVLEVGGGEGALTARAGAAGGDGARGRARRAAARRRSRRSPPSTATSSCTSATRCGSTSAALDPPPTRMVANLPYSIATPLLLRTIAELPGLESWTLMVQREIADRLRAAPGSRTYGAPSVLVQLACEVRLLRSGRPGGVHAAPAGRLGADRAAADRARRPRRRSPTLVRDGVRAPAQVAGAVARARAARGRARRRARRSSSSGLPADARAEQLAPAQFAALAAALEAVAQR